MDEAGLPDDVALVRVTEEWDQTTVPQGLRRSHRLADDVWGRLVVRAGTVRLTFEDDQTARLVTAGEAAVLPPGRPHHVEPVDAVRFAVEFHRVPA